MDYKQYCKHQQGAVNRIYGYVDELALVCESVDVDYITAKTREIARAIEVEAEGMEEAVKEYHGI